MGFECLSFECVSLAKGKVIYISTFDYFNLLHFFLQIVIKAKGFYNFNLILLFFFLLLKDPKFNYYIIYYEYNNKKAIIKANTLSCLNYYNISLLMFIIYRFLYGVLIPFSICWVSRRNIVLISEFIALAAFRIEK